MKRKLTCAVAAGLVSSSALAQQVGSVDATFENGILVISSDILACPYRLVQPVTVNVFSRASVTTAHPPSSLRR